RHPGSQRGSRRRHGIRQPGARRRPAGSQQRDLRDAARGGDAMSAAAPLVFITGASSGIGQALAARFHRAGYRLALVSRRAASVAGVRGIPGHGAYSSSKAAVISYCESLRGELRPSGVRVVTIAPGYIDTPLTQGNRYSMPFLMSADRFADRAFRAIVAGDSL